MINRRAFPRVARSASIRRCRRRRRRRRRRRDVDEIVQGQSAGNFDTVPSGKVHALCAS